MRALGNGFRVRGFEARFQHRLVECAEVSSGICMYVYIYACTSVCVRCSEFEKLDVL